MHLIAAVYVPVYPRGCGEHASWIGSGGQMCGLSPWVRGTRPEGGLLKSIDRFIPVGAGNTIARFTNHLNQAVYPRGCGEHTPFTDIRFIGVGLSPWVRGTRVREILMTWAFRFIPVGAGNTIFDSVFGRICPVYPRGCGEHFQRLVIAVFIIGLSPWVRGTHVHKETTDMAWRFIPVGAGNTWPPSASTTLAPVYPRGCGEHVSAAHFNYTHNGLSPWVRGTLLVNTIVF